MLTIEQNLYNYHFWWSFNNISKELGTNGNICETIDKNFDYTNIVKKTFEKEYDSQFEDYQDNGQKIRANKLIDKFSNITIH